MAPPGASEFEFDGITARRAEILSLIERGFSVVRVARELEIAPTTVRTHVEEIRRRHDCSTMNDLRAFWRANRGPWLAALARRGGVPLREVPDWDGSRSASWPLIS